MNKIWKSVLLLIQLKYIPLNILFFLNKSSIISKVDYYLSFILSYSKVDEIKNDPILYNQLLK